ncbi:MAG: PA2169 family four-helix-bundle protein [Paraglaciecola sp.]|uniref:PA2169 family four-helix-bundle protein n=1 Tax=Pseudomonadati TaxID=3379134 RepID=UPI00273FB4A3|nr:PA2169 family four-helix-bundle protein [Paraglaciecola sp.]MDP5028972.1 PA2169 family four-helix-bundle protein [Paraglaciecola sp.]MDP5132640.1 PA2169 family four-helix-bundle protein [Paraglaciecola sp.]
MQAEIKQVEKVTDIIKVLNGGISFYEEALEKVDSQSLKTMFGRLILQKRHAVAMLQPFAIEEQGEVEKDTAITIDIRKLYTKLLGAMSSDTDHTYVEQLEEVEDKTLEVIRDALEHEQPLAVKQLLLGVLKDAKMSHDEMKTLQELTS